MRVVEFLIIILCIAIAAACVVRAVRGNNKKQ